MEGNEVNDAPPRLRGCLIGVFGMAACADNVHDSLLVAISLSTPYSGAIFDPEGSIFDLPFWLLRMPTIYAKQYNN